MHILQSYFYTRDLVRNFEIISWWSQRPALDDPAALDAGTAPEDKNKEYSKASLDFDRLTQILIKICHNEVILELFDIINQASIMSLWKTRKLLEKAQAENPAEPLQI